MTKDEAYNKLSDLVNDAWHICAEFKLDGTEGYMSDIEDYIDMIKVKLRQTESGAKDINL